jgi:hypothetical protein
VNPSIEPNKHDNVEIRRKNREFSPFKVEQQEEAPKSELDSRIEV